MNRIVVLGAGRSAHYLIEYLVNWCRKNGWQIDIADLNTSSVLSITSDYPQARALDVNLADDAQRRAVIEQAHTVVSMLPAFMHPLVARDCIDAGANMATASYESAELRELEPEIREKGLQFLNECGLDPGLDHMSAMRVINRLKSEGAKIETFRSYCGGLVAADSNDNPWGYKFSWNPRNVILAGQGTARYRENNQLRFTPYHQLFRNPEVIRFSADRCYDGYPNRDSLMYQQIYGLETVGTLVRGTLRYPGYCKAWNIFVQLGITDDSYLFPLEPGMSYRDFASAFLPYHADGPLAALSSLAEPAFTPEAIEMVKWTGLFNPEAIKLTSGSPAQILQSLLEPKWLLKPEDRDLIVMQHLFSGTLHGKPFSLSSSLFLEGEDSHHTAMAKTVGLPLAAGIRQLLESRFTRKGLIIPVDPLFYEPVLTELELEHGITFKEAALF